MKKIKVIITMLFSAITASSFSQDKIVEAPEDFYKLSFNTIDGDKYNFEKLKGKFVLIVNTASKCGYTPQFEDLEKLYKKYKDKLVVLGFPSNDFLWQDPGSNKEIKEFCQLNYGVTFQMMEKASVKGAKKSSVFKWLTTKESNGWNEKEPSWNFCKYLIDTNGNLVGFFPSKVKPGSSEILKYL